MRQRRFRAICSRLSGLVGLATLGAADPTPGLKSDVGALAQAIFRAADAAERERLLAAAPAEMQNPAALLAALTLLEYQAGLEGDYARCEAGSRFLLELNERQQDAPGIARSRARLANALRELGQPREALRLTRQAVDYWEAVANEAELATVLVGRGIVELTLADFQSAQRSLQRAIALAERKNDQRILVPALNTLGNVYRQQGRPERAIDCLERARRFVGDDTAWNMAFLFNNLGQCWEQLGEAEKAAEFVGKALAVAERVKFRPRVANAHTFLGEIRLGQGRAAEAAKHFELSRALSAELQDPLSEARALLGLARVALTGGKAAEGLSLAERASELFGEIGQHDFLAPALTAAGRCLRALGRDDEARDRFERAIAAVERVRTQLAGNEADAQSFLERQVAPFQELVGLLVDTGRVVEALQRAEQAKARVLLDLTRRSRPDLEAVLTASEREGLGARQRRIADANRALGAAQRRTTADPAALASARAELRQARSEAEEYRDRVAHAHPELRVAGEARFGAFDVRGLAGLARNGTAWLEFVVTEDRTFVFCGAGPEGAAAVRIIPLRRSELARRVESFRRALAGRDLAWRREARALQTLLLAPAAAALAEAKQVLIIPDGALWELPFAALVDAQDRCLLELHALQFGPSLQTVLTPDTEPVRVIVNRPQRRLLLAGDPNFGATGEFTPLPEAARQLREIAALYAPDDVTALVQSGATAQACREALPRHRVLHFATHGVLNNAEPLASHLVLNQAGLAEGEDGLLEAREVLNQRLHARLAVLAACETGRGRIGAGEGMIGLSWAFAVAGCEATVVSQWKVESTSASDVLIGLHRRLAAPEPMPAPQALRAAALEIARKPEFAHPFYWAAFVFIGRES